MDRLSEIRERCEAAIREDKNGLIVNGVWFDQIPYLLAEIERLKQANRIAAAAWDNSALNFSEAQMERWKARAEKAEAERDTYRAALEALHINVDLLKGE